MVALLIAAAILGDAANFTIGKYFGARLFSNPDSKIFRQSHLAKTHAFYEKYGGKTIIIARFVPIVRTFAPFVAGMANMHYGRFIRYNIIGAIAWVVLFAYAGYSSPTPNRQRKPQPRTGGDYRIVRPARRGRIVRRETGGQKTKC